MDKKILFSGNLQNENLLKVLYRIYTENLSGTLVLKTGDSTFNIIIKKGIIIFASSDSKQNTLSSYLIKHKIIDQIDLDNALTFSKEKKKRFGRALLELGLINYDTLWESVKNHMEEMILFTFSFTKGNYELLDKILDEDENITLDLNIPQLLIKGSRLRTDKDLIEEKLAATKEVYKLNYKNLENLNLKPYEKHILNLIKKEHLMENIIKRSELLRFDTLKLIDLFLTMKIITNNKEDHLNKKPEQKKIVMENEKVSGAASFVSFAEALKYYNNKYELIFKVFSKEIGPIALSILQKSINDISENLPVYLQKIKWNSNGTIQEETLLKSLYHKDFHENIAEFLTGLEEILYAGIYTIRKNISPEKEKTVLKWINKPVK